MTTTTSAFASLVESDPAVYQLVTRTPGPEGKLPLTDELLRNAPSGDLFGWTQNVGMGLSPVRLGAKEFLILSTHGGLRGENGEPIALGYH
jgi:xylonate dehydratase